GRLDDDLRAAMRATESPFLKAVAADDGPTALAGIAPAVAPERTMGSEEYFRADVVSALLALHDAPWEERLRFASRILDTGAAHAHLAAMRALQAAPGLEALERVLPALRPALAHPLESHRVAAAALLAPLGVAEAVPALLEAFYDGDARSAAQASQALRAARPDLPPLDPSISPRERRRAVRALRAGIALVPRGRE
ncbi:MAG: hypothetical protein ACREID_04710, partial [Planctomycetota bacterium]